MREDSTCIGRVRHVLGATVTVALNQDLAGVAPIYRGRLQPVGQIGALVRIPQGIVDVIGSVTLVGIAELSGPLPPTSEPQRDERWLQVQLLGEIDRGSGKFQRGVGSYPGLDDAVHFATPEELAAVFPAPDHEHLRIGCVAAAEDVPVSLHAARLVVRHAAVVGSTGAGKTSAVASMLQSFVSGGWVAANIVVIDPHGEYGAALGGAASVRSVLASGSGQLRIPYWALPALDILRIFAGTLGGATVQSRFIELVAAERRSFAQQADWLNLEATAITADTPIPFDLRLVWHSLDAENRETRTRVADPTTAQLIDEGDPLALQSAQYAPYGPGGQEPHKAPTYGMYGTVPDLLRLGLLDPQLAFLQAPLENAEMSDPLEAAFLEWIGGQQPISVLDFSGVPARAADAAIGVVLNLLLEVALRTPPEGPGIGRPSPVFIVLEEAHRYLGEAAASMTRTAANRIAREGRKYGVGLLLVTQRPTELPDTALAQCGTVIALRLSNSGDQGAIKSALPDTIAGLAAALPSLRTHEAIVSGEGVVLPTRCILDKPEPWPSAADPSLSAWRTEASEPNIAAALAAWRGIYSEEAL